MSRFHGGDAEITDLKTHLGLKERDERTEDASTRLRGRPRIGAALHYPGVLPFVFFLQRLLAAICHKNRWKNSRRNLGRLKWLQIAIFRNTIFL